MNVVYSVRGTNSVTAAAAATSSAFSSLSVVADVTTSVTSSVRAGVSCVTTTTSLSVPLPSSSSSTPGGFVEVTIIGVGLIPSLSAVVVAVVAAVVVLFSASSNRPLSSAACFSVEGMSRGTRSVEGRSLSSISASAVVSALCS